VPGLQRFVLRRARQRANGNAAVTAAAGSSTPRVARVSPESWPDANLIERAAQATTRLVFGAILRFYVGLRVDGLEQVPNDGPFIAVSNHNSHIDAAALLVLLGKAGRPVHPVAAQDYFFSTPLRSRLSRNLLSAVPFSRQTPSPASLGLAVSLLRRGHSLIFFPEGGRSTDGRLRDFKRGVGLVALKSGVPIVPVRVSGSFRALPKGSYFPRRHRVHVRFGAPISSLEYLTNDGAVDPARRLTDDVRAAVERLAVEA
jgi:1-acyl-sn-glycerol-3-phosphate acyltransferase